MVFTVLGAVAELERELIRERVEAVFSVRVPIQRRPIDPTLSARLY